METCFQGEAIRTLCLQCLHLDGQELRLYRIDDADIHFVFLVLIICIWSNPIAWINVSKKYGSARLQISSSLLLGC